MRLKGCEAMQKLGNIFVGDKRQRTIIGTLSYDAMVHHAMIGLDLVSLLQACRKHEHGFLQACCLPYEKLDNPPPYLCCDIQFCKTRNRREKMGYLWTEADERGPAYQVRLAVDVVLKRFGVVWFHLHEQHGPTEEDEQHGKTEG